jgi:hypothetical protein
MRYLNPWKVTLLDFKRMYTTTVFKNFDVKKLNFYMLFLIAFDLAV